MNSKNFNVVRMKRVLDGMNDEFTLRNGLSYSVKSTAIIKEWTFSEAIGVDTETYQGSCRLICLSVFNKDNFDITPKYNSQYKPTFDTCLRLLTYHIKQKGVYRFFYNIDFDISAILKLYTKDDKIEFIDLLSKGIPMRYIDNRGVEYEFKWIRSKMFSIKVIKAKRSVVWTDLHSFDNRGLNVLAKQYLNLKKLDIIDSKRLNNDKQYWKDNQYDIVKYCIRDAEITAKVGVLLVNSVIMEKKLLPKSLVSNASLSKQNYRFTKKDDNGKLEDVIPNLKYVPIQIVQIGFDTYFGGRFEIFRKGFFENGFLTDIVSEYPNKIKNLVGMDCGIWIRRKNKIILPKKEPFFAFYYAKLDIPKDNRVSTIPMKMPNGIVSFPNGIIEKWFTWYDLDLMRPFIKEIVDCYEYVKHPNRNLTYPFRKKTLELFKRKSEIDKKINPMGYNINKLTMNALYGCTIERHINIYLEKDIDGNIIRDKEGKPIEIKKLRAGVLFNPIYASHITSYGRWKLFKEIPKSEWFHILGVHTDSIITDKDLSEFLKIGKNLGNWDIEGKGKIILLNTGTYQVGSMVKTRGIPKKMISQCLCPKHREYILKTKGFDIHKPNWLRFLLENSELSKRTFFIRHMRKVREALVRDKSLDLMNTMTDVERSVQLDSDTKRSWFSKFDNFYDVINKQIDSLPLFFDGSELQPNDIALGKMFDIDTDLIEKILEGKDDL
ncbi:MAG: hypothetical protein ACFFCM_19185 [Promethearchaeota archaeon]